MSWSYDPARTEDALNHVRLMIGDTDTSDQQLSDEEITSLLLQADGNRYMAAAAAAEAIRGKYSRYGASSQEAARYGELAESLKEKAGPCL